MQGRCGRRNHMCCWALVFAAIALGAGPAHAQLQSIGPRFSAGISAFPPGPDIAGMGSASSAVPYSSGSNPATLVYFDHYGEYKPFIGISETYIDLGFDKGPDTWVWINEASGKLGKGYYRLAYALYESDKERIIGQLPLQLRFHGRTVQFGYARRVFESERNKLSLGANVILHDRSQSDVFAGPLRVGKVKIRGAQVPSLQAGLHYEWNNKIFLGLMYEYLTSDSVTSVLGFGLGQEDENVETIRPGIAIRPWRGATIGLDWQLGQVRSDSFDVDINRFFFGIEQFVNPNLAFYLGSADGGLTAGFWFNIKERVAVSYGYQARGLRSLDAVFGRSRLHTLSIGVTF